LFFLLKIITDITDLIGPEQLTRKQYRTIAMESQYYRQPVKVTEKPFHLDPGGRVWRTGFEILD
jgi:hypothetical protein